MLRRSESSSNRNGKADRTHRNFFGKVIVFVQIRCADHTSPIYSLVAVDYRQFLSEGNGLESSGLDAFALFEVYQLAVAHQFDGIRAYRTLAGIANQDINFEILVNISDSGSTQR